MQFGEKLIALRKQNNYSQEDLAEQIGVSRQAISRWESGSTLPDAMNLIQLSNLFHVSIDSLLRDEMTGKEEKSIEHSAENNRMADHKESNTYRRDLTSAVMWMFGAVFFLFGGLLEAKIVYIVVVFLYLTCSCSYFYNVLKEKE